MDKAPKKLCVLFYVVFCSVCLAAGGSMAETDHGMRQVKGYPASFDGGGEIDYYKDRYISIGDLSLNLSSKATFNTPYSLNCSPAWFTAGKYVGYLLDSKGEIKSLWLLKKGYKRVVKE